MGSEPRGPDAFRSPAEEKALDYERQRRGFSEYAHAMRHGKWRRKRRAAQHGERRAVHQRLAAVRGTDDAYDFLLEIDLAGCERDRIGKKWVGPALGEWIEQQREQRWLRFGWNYFKRPYSSSRDREAFAAALGALIRGKSGHGTLALAREFEAMLSSHHRTDDCTDMNAPAWLKAFLTDEPTWEPRLRAWIERVTTPPSR